MIRKMTIGPARALVAAGAMLLAGCADQPPPKQARVPHHVSPAAVAAPVLPPGSFDLAKSRDALAAAQAALAAGRNEEARSRAEAAVDAWPGEAKNWAALAAARQALGDKAGADRAAFFEAKVDLVAAWPPHAATLGFQTMTEEPPGTKVDGRLYDQALLNDATLLWAFYDATDPIREKPEGPPVAESFREKYPYATMLAIGGVVAGVLTGLNEIK